MKKIITITLFCFCTAQAFSQEDVGKIKWTLEACIKHAFENNISIKQSQLDIEGADINKSDAIGNFLPSLNINASNNWNSGLTQDVVTGVLVNQVTRNFSTGGTVGINIFSGLQNWRTLQRAKLSQLASQYSLEQMEDDIALFVANSYLQVLVSKQTLQVLEEQNKITQQQIEQTEALIEAGTIPQGDILELQATNADEQQQIIVAKNDVKISLISLAQALLIDDYENFEIADESYDIPITDIVNRDIDDIIEEAKRERYEVKVAEKNVEIAEKNVEIARGAYYPTLQGFFNYNTRESDRERVGFGGVDPDNPTRQIGFVESTGDPVVTQNFLSVALDPLPFIDQLWRNDGITYGVQLNIPVFNGFATRNNVKRRQIDLERSKNQLQQAELDLEADVYQAYVDAQGAAKAYEAAVKSVEAQQNAYDFAKERFDVGMSNAFDLSQSKTRLTNAQNQMVQAKYDYIFRIKVLELFFGERPVE
ncbi:TolC family protein [Mesohalobacter halotolerans]|uniref:TolC family protein n=1 Tax=Mesohalobacter halotolerans TaxID=1883405 RepID=A0A4U5TTW5_9FLAO|nr:TolC family protein [Mesohalobacter halotolerans]MBS3738395.1 TolC family protein [Psychroflexus sp.]TKS57341.1 TolC family protein [Mesohalobacter halotolerans]